MIDVVVVDDAGDAIVADTAGAIFVVAVVVGVVVVVVVILLLLLIILVLVAVAHPDFTRFYNIPELAKYENWKLYDMISSTLIAVYNHFCREAGLTSRMLRRKYPDLGVRIVHDAEASIDPNTGLLERHKRALRLGSQANKRSKDATSGGHQNWAAEWSDQEEEDSSWNSWRTGDDWDSWGSWRDQKRTWHQDVDDDRQVSSSSWSRPTSWTRR